MNILPYVQEGMSNLNSIYYSQIDETIQTFCFRLGECFLFSIEPKMAVFHSTGKDENFQMLSSDSLALGGSKGTKTGEKIIRLYRI